MTLDVTIVRHKRFGDLHRRGALASPAPKRFGQTTDFIFHTNGQVLQKESDHAGFILAELPERYILQQHGVETAAKILYES